MSQFIQLITDINDKVNGVVWGLPLIVLILATGIFMCVRTRFFHISKAKHVTQNTFLAIFKKKDVTASKEKSAISQFQAFTTALAATIGTGNIAGVATAIAVGGPGAVFWMWVSAFFGMMTAYSENVLGIFYRRKNKDGEWSGGAMYYLKDGLNNKLGNILAVLFALFCVIASFGIGNMTQVNSISTALYDSFNLPSIITGIAVAIVTALVILGGIKRIGKVTEVLVPFMAFAYIIGSIIIIIMNIGTIPSVFASIFKGAFGIKAAAGGIVGAAIKKAITMGFKRGIFSNEAGLGSSVMANAASDVKEPVIQGMWGIFEVFADTIVVCTLTALVILSSGVVKPYTTENIGVITVTDAKIDEVNLFDREIEKTAYSENLALSINPETQVIVALDENDKVIGVLNTETDSIIALDDKPESATYGMILEGVPFVSTAFSHGLGSFAGGFVSIAVALFAFSTIIGWSFYGTKACEFLFGRKSTIIYKLLFIVATFGGATLSLELVWGIADTLNGLMAIPNLIGVLTLSGTVVAITRNYKKRKFGGDTSIQPMLSIHPDIQAEQEWKLERE